MPPAFTSLDYSEEELKKIPELTLGQAKLPLEKEEVKTVSFRLKESFKKSAIFQCLSFQ